jgi:hypothetical protein
VGRRSKALAPTFDDASFEKVAYYEEEASYEDDVYEEAANNDEWRREPRRYALG